VERFRRHAVERLAQATGLDPERVDALVEVPALERGDLAFPCFTLAKERRQAPPAIAKAVAAAIPAGGDVAAVEAEGPYVNLRADRAALAQRTLAAVEAAGAAWGRQAEPGAGTAVVDFSSPNVAKPLAFHHLRSTMIGNALCRIHAACGWKVVAINHLGDWGTAFGKLLLGWELEGGGLDLATLDSAALNDLYVRVNGLIAEETRTGASGLEERARAWFLRLERGDPEARGLWQRFREVSLADFEAVYRLLGVRFDEVTGESAYEGDMPGVIQELREKGLLVESEGADVVRLEHAGLPPCLIRKADGATLYATRDLAAAKRRRERHGFDRALYVIDRGQALHVAQFRRVLLDAGHAWAEGIVHVPFGVIRMGGKKTSTRKGSVVLLADVLEAAIERVRALIAERNPGLEGADAVAQRVGVGAVVFHDLKHHRENDLDFDLDAIVSFEGRTGPYAMYSHARACSILARAETALPPAARVDASLLAHPAEEALVRLVALLPAKVLAARRKDDPSEVARHVLDLCEAFHAYHTAGGRDRDLRVLADEPALRAARLRLTDAVRVSLAVGLGLLGIEAPHRM
jgi:arginyl-tRNA synthetase